MFVQENEFLINGKVNKCNLLAYLLLTSNTEQGVLASEWITR